jgi:hypothetical protein
MTVVEYCCRVQEALLAKQPADPLEGTWFSDTGRILRAVTLAMECRNERALEIAEDVAERWNLVV